MNGYKEKNEHKDKNDHKEKKLLKIGGFEIEVDN
jgi:hypothetical protein